MDFIFKLRSFSGTQATRLEYLVLLSKADSFQRTKSQKKFNKSGFVSALKKRRWCCRDSPQSCSDDTSIGKLSHYRRTTIEYRSVSVGRFLCKINLIKLNVPNTFIHTPRKTFILFFPFRCAENNEDNLKWGLGVFLRSLFEGAPAEIGKAGQWREKGVPRKRSSVSSNETSYAPNEARSNEKEIECINSTQQQQQRLCLSFGTMQKFEYFSVVFLRRRLSLPE